MGCGNELTEKDFELMEESATGKFGQLDESIITKEDRQEIDKRMEEANQKLAEIDAMVEKMKNIVDAKPIGKVIRVYEHTEVAEMDAEELAERIMKADPNDAILPLKNEELSPFFVPGFKDAGDKAHLSEKFPEVKVYSPIQPTIENLGNMLSKRNPYNPWDEKNTWHHKDQKVQPVMIIKQKMHRKDSGVLHGKEALDGRKQWEKDKPQIMKEITKEYLGKFAEHKSVINALIKKSDEAIKLRDDKQ